MNVGAAARVTAIVLALAIGLAVAYAGLRLVGEQHKANCLADAELRYPAVGLEGDSGQLGLGSGDTVTNRGKRRSAADDCEATIF